MVVGGAASLTPTETVTVTVTVTVTLAPTLISISRTLCGDTRVTGAVPLSCEVWPVCFGNSLLVHFLV